MTHWWIHIFDDTWPLQRYEMAYDAPGFSENDNFGRELFFPSMIFCSSLTRFSCSLRIFCRSSSIFRCSSIIANRSSAYCNFSFLIKNTDNSIRVKWLTSFFWASSIFLLFSAMIVSSSSRFFSSSSYKWNFSYSLR